MDHESNVIPGKNVNAMTRTPTIHHTVFFKLKHKHGSVQEQAFLDSAKALSSLPGIENFNCLRQVSKKNKFEFGLSMEFADQHAYDQYNHHPDHVAFVEQIWLKEVEDFMEIDYQVMPL